MTTSPEPAGTRRSRSLRTTVIIMTAAALAIFAGLFLLVFSRTMPAMLLRAETEYLEEQLHALEYALEDAREKTFTMAVDIAIWDATAQYARGDYPTLIEDTWPDEEPLAAYDFNLIQITDAGGGHLYRAFYDYAADLPMAEPAGLAGYLDALAARVMAAYRTGLLPGEGGDLAAYGIGGVARHQDGYYLLVAMPVLTDRASTDPAGVVVLGSVLDEGYFRRLTHFDDAGFAWVEAQTAGAAVDGRFERAADTVATLLQLETLDGGTAVLRMSDAREIYAAGQQSLLHTALLLAAIILAFGVVFCLLINRLLLAPLARMSGDVGAIGPGGSLPVADYSGAAEFMALGTAVNGTLERLEQSNITLEMLENILGAMDAYLYVTDPETDEILFINDKMREHFAGGKDLVGMPCWQVLQQGMAARCTFCPVPKLLENGGRPVVWEENNTLTGRAYRNTDSLIPWKNGRQVHLQYSVDITDERRNQQALARRLEQQQVMTEMARTFISTGNRDTLIERALGMVGGFFDVGMIIMTRFNDDASVLNFDTVWYNEKQNVPRIPHRNQPVSQADGIYQNFIVKGLDHFVCPDTAVLGEDHAIKSLGVKSFVSAAIRVEDRPWGVLSFDDLRGPRQWGESDVQLIRMLTSVISAVVTRSATEKQLLRMSSIVQSSPQYISYFTADGEYEYLNPGSVAITGYPVDELMLGGPALLFREEDFNRISAENIPEALVTGQSSFEVQLIRRDGTERTMAFSMFSIDDGSGTLGSIARDITQQHLLEKALVASKEEAEAAREQAEQASHAKSNFLSRMSHEMRTPMNAIIGMTHIAKTSNDPERKAYCLDKIDEASTHLLGVINDILDVSKIEAGKFELVPVSFGIEEMLQRVAGVMGFRVSEKKQRFSVRLDRAVPKTIIADDQRLAQVLTNLLSNAVKFTPEGGDITLTIDEAGAEGDCHTLRFVVADTGIGLTDEQRGRLFQRFEQADGGTARKYGGTGLGLSISKSIVELMGGTIWVESAPEKGATFGFTVTVARGEDPKPLAIDGIDWKDLRVMAVDDAPEVRDYFAEVAESLGLSCVVADGGTAAERLLADPGKPYNIIFVDWSMPGMDGIELTRRIRQRYGEDAVIIMISGADWSEIEDAARTAGVDGFLPKPLFPSQIVNCINTYLGARKAHDDADAREADDTDIFAGRRVLLAEDIEVNREIVEAMLEHTGLQIDSAGDGAEAVRMFGEAPGKYDLILMDIHMPEVDGYEATRRIRALPLPEAQTVPIVAMTANVFREDVERCLAAGMNDHVGKPVDARELVNTLRRYLLSNGRGGGH